MNNYGFDLLDEARLPEIASVATLWKDRKTGAEILSVKNDDENKCFGVSFYTPPKDSTGVAHILEHSVLCGSKKYPVKEPFVELLKGSLQTFLNAFTFPDKTCYPVASANLQDFYNLIDVYIDAVFHPLISENIFRQEGWHIDAESVDGIWNYKGVVFNEMKGVYSQADSILAEKSQQAIFPDNLYSLDSGGNPADIPSLTWESFRNFHQTCYNPANAKFFFWGNDPEETRLSIVKNAIAHIKPGRVLPVTPLQKKFASPVEITHYYPAARDEKRAQFTLNWLLPERGNVLEALKMEMLEHILEGMPGSPLRRVLIESGLGEDTAGCGLETDLRQMYYSTGLKGILPENIDEAEALILQTIKELAENGIPEEMVKSAVNSVEFAYRENNSGRFPRGLAAMIQALSTWLYGGNPLAALAWEQPLKLIKDQLATGEKVFEATLREYFLDNTHRVKVILLPDQNLAAQRQENENARLENERNSLNLSEKENLVKNTKELLEAQIKPDSPENLAKIPALTVDDLPKREKAIPQKIVRKNPPVLIHELSANGVLYVNLLMGLKNLPENLAPLFPLFCRSLLEWGTAKQDYTQLGLKIASATGGIGASPLPGLTFKEKKPFLYLGLQGKAVASHAEDLFDLFSEILLEPQQNQDIILRRLPQMLLEEKARLEYGLQAAGHATVAARLRSHYRPEMAIIEQFSGVSQLRFLQELEKRLQHEPEKVILEFSQLRNHIISSANAILDFTGDAATLKNVVNLGEKLLARLPDMPADTAGRKIADYEKRTDLPSAEAFITQGQVNYVGKAANLYDLGYQFNGSANVIMRWLRMGPLWENVRVKGGAYGASCALDKSGGTYVCTSYRDPNLEKTLEAFDNLGPYLKNFKPGKAQLSQAIIGAMGELDAYLLPDAKAARALGWYLTGETEELRQQTRDEMFATTEKDFQNFAEILNIAAREGSICVLGGTDTAKAASLHGWSASQL